MRNSAALSALQHLVLRVQLLLPLVLPIVAVRVGDRRGPAAVKLLLFDLVDLKFQFSGEFDEGLPIDSVNLAVEDSEAFFLMPPHTLQQLEKLPITVARSKDEEADA